MKAGHRVGDWKSSICLPRRLGYIDPTVSAARTNRRMTVPGA